MKKSSPPASDDDLRYIGKVILAVLTVMLLATILLALGILPVHDGRKDCKGRVLEVHDGHGGWVCTP